MVMIPRNTRRVRHSEPVTPGYERSRKGQCGGEDLLYRYYGQLELLDLRFPVDENHIKVSFTWYVRPGTILLVRILTWSVTAGSTLSHISQLHSIP
jgi:hypothetical protein